MNAIETSPIAQASRREVSGAIIGMIVAPALAGRKGVHPSGEGSSTASADASGGERARC